MILVLMYSYPIQNKWYTMLRLVIYYFRHVESHAYVVVSVLVSTGIT